jgi:ATP-dependent protease HslVU (ClpYQ) ATPase subunit
MRRRSNQLVVVQTQASRVVSMLGRARSQLSRRKQLERARHAEVLIHAIPFVGPGGAAIGNAWRWLNQMVSEGRIAAFWRRNPLRAYCTRQRSSCEVGRCG